MVEGLAMPAGEPVWAAELGSALSAAITFGARSGVGRVALTGMSGRLDDFWENYESVAAQPLLDLAAEEDLDPQGVAMVSEVIATAVAVRIAHGERRLTQDEVRELLPQLATFLNTFIHGCDPT